MERPGGDGGGGASIAKVDGIVGCVGVVSVAELADLVVAPAGGCSVIEKCAGVEVAGGDGGGGASDAEVDGVAGCVGVGVVAVAELTTGVVSPAGDLAVFEDCTGVEVAGGDGGGGASSAKVDGVAGCVGVGVATVAELTPKVPTPAGDLTVVE